MLDWVEIKGLNQRMSYDSNIENGVKLPELKEEVLFCMTDYKDETKDSYFVGYIGESENGLKLVHPFLNGVEPFTENIQWARFNKPETKNNIGYAIAYIDENGNNFHKNIPYIVTVKKEEVRTKMKEFTEAGYLKIIAFSYVQPCTFQYDWEYIEKHMIEE